MASTDLVPSSSDGERSALSDFLSRTVGYETAGALIPRDLLQFGLLGSAVVIVTGLVALVLPDAAAIRSGGFFLVLSSQAADLGSMMQALALPAIVCGIALLGLDLYLMQAPSTELGRTAVVAQAAAGGIGGIIGTVFLALVLLNLAIWIAIIACGLAVVGLILGAMGGG